MQSGLVEAYQNLVTKSVTGCLITAEYHTSFLGRWSWQLCRLVSKEISGQLLPVSEGEAWQKQSWNDKNSSIFAEPSSKDLLQRPGD